MKKWLPIFCNDKEWGLVLNAGTSEDPKLELQYTGDTEHEVKFHAAQLNGEIIETAWGTS